MTFIEKFMMNNSDKKYDPDDVIPLCCPHMEGLESEPDNCDGDCVACWNREMPKTENDIRKGEINMNKPTEEFTVNKASLEPKSSEELMAEVRALKEQVRVLKLKEDYDKSATELKMMYDALLNAGFSKEEAWTLFMTICKKGSGE